MMPTFRDSPKSRWKLTVTIQLLHTTLRDPHRPEQAKTTAPAWPHRVQQPQQLPRMVFRHVGVLVEGKTSVVISVAPRSEAVTFNSAWTQMATTSCRPPQLLQTMMSKLRP